MQDEPLDGLDLQPISGDEEPITHLRLYIAPPAPTSIRARANLAAAIAGLDPSGARIAVEIVDVAVNPLRVVKDRVIVTPTLMVCDAAAAPPLIGDLSDAAIVRAFLEAALAKK